MRQTIGEAEGICREQWPANERNLTVKKRDKDGLYQRGAGILNTRSLMGAAVNAPPAPSHTMRPARFAQRSMRIVSHAKLLHWQSNVVPTGTFAYGPRAAQEVPGSSFSVIFARLALQHHRNDGVAQLNLLANSR